MSEKKIAPCGACMNDAHRADESDVSCMAARAFHEYAHRVFGFVPAFGSAYDEDFAVWLDAHPEPITWAEINFDRVRGEP